MSRFERLIAEKVARLQGLSMEGEPSTPALPAVAEPPPESTPPAALTSPKKRPAEASESEASTQGESSAGSNNNGNNNGKKRKKATKPKAPVCTCAISSACELARQNDVKDCRAVQSNVARRKAKTPVPMRILSTKQQTKVKRDLNEMTEILSLHQRSSTSTPSDCINLYKQMRLRAQRLPFFDAHPSFKETLKAKFLDDGGLKAIIDDPAVPWDIKLDVDIIKMRWEKDDIDTSLDRGLIIKDGKTTSRSFDPMWPFKVSCSYLGEANLRNGQWFPFQICAHRDGAHGEMEAGIHGRDKYGACSIVLGSGAGYADTDEGEVIYYSGTHGKNGEISTGTSYLRISFAKKTAVRVLRSSRLPAANKYRPKIGLRYDGIYYVVEQEEKDVNGNQRFKLQRKEGQTPIRHTGPEIRPNAKEIEEFKRLQELTSASKRGL